MPSTSEPGLPRQDHDQRCLPKTSTWHLSPAVVPAVVGSEDSVLVPDDLADQLVAHLNRRWPTTADTGLVREMLDVAHTHVSVMLAHNASG